MYTRVAGRRIYHPGSREAYTPPGYIPYLYTLGTPCTYLMLSPGLVMVRQVCAVRDDEALGSTLRIIREREASLRF